MKNEQPDGWTYCPECGCEAFEKGIWREGNEEHICTDCSQSWFADIDYSDTVHGNLRRMAVAARTTKRESVKEDRCLCGSNSPVYCTFGTLPPNCKFVGKSKQIEGDEP